MEPLPWTARKLSLETGLAYNTVWGIWNNKTKRADLDTLDALVKVLSIQPNQLIGPGGNQPEEDGTATNNG